MGICLMVFINDILIMSQSHDEAIRNTQKVVNFLHNLGYSIHPEKVTAPPSCSLEFLGIQIITSLMSSGAYVQSMLASLPDPSSALC